MGTHLLQVTGKPKAKPGSMTWAVHTSSVMLSGRERTKTVPELPGMTLPTFDTSYYVYRLWTGNLRLLRSCRTCVPCLYFAACAALAPFLHIVRPSPMIICGHCISRTNLLPGM